MIDPTISDPEGVVLLEAGSLRYFFFGQLRHLSSAVLLVIMLWIVVSPYLGNDRILGMSEDFWFWLAVGLVVLQQVLGWLVFRLQLGWGALTRWFGKADLIVWSILFIPLLIARPFLVLVVGIADAGSMALPAVVRLPLGSILLVPAVYTLFSVVQYFGFERAIGGDHFRRRYREMPLVNQGAFKWSENAMYAFVFLSLWSIAIFAGSWAAFSLALFQHVYVWAHYYFTEKPDMELIYYR